MPLIITTNNINKTSCSSCSLFSLTANSCDTELLHETWSVRRSDDRGSSISLSLPSMFKFHQALENAQKRYAHNTKRKYSLGYLHSAVHFIVVWWHYPHRILSLCSHSPSNEVKYGRVSFGLVFCFENGENTCVSSQNTLWGEQNSKSWTWRASHKRAVRSEYVWVALAVHVLSVTLDAVASVDFGQRRRHVGGRAEDVSVGESTGKLHPLLIPVSPENALNLQQEEQRRWEKNAGVWTYLQGWS